jgi:hypothetical protein
MRGNTAIGKRLGTRDVPEDLRIFGERLADIGIRLTPPTIGPGDPQPEPLDLGVCLSDAVIKLRRSE